MNAPLNVVAIIAISGCLGSLEAQTPAAPPANQHHLSLTATNSGSGGSAKAQANVKITPAGGPRGNTTAGEERRYTNSRESEDGLDLNVEIRNLARTPDQAKLEWFFYARNVNGGPPHVFDSGTQDVTVPPSDTSKVELHSKDLTSKEERKLVTSNNYDRFGKPILPKATVKRTGEKPIGWAVRLTDDGAIVELRASSPTFETLARTAAAPAPEGPAGKKKK